MENRFEKFTYLTFKTAKLIQRIKNIEMAEAGLKAVHVMCIYYLNKNKEGLTSKALVELTLEDKAAVSRALSLLKEKGYIEYSGGYNALITLTDEGKKLAMYIDEKSRIALNNSSYDISEDERETFYTTLKKIENNIEEYYNKLLTDSKQGD